MVIAIVVTWALLGLGVFIIAMRGPHGARAAADAGKPKAPSKPGRRAVTAGIAVMFAVGLTVPALVLAFNGENKASVAVGGLHLNAEQQRGRNLFAQACAVCHTLAAARSYGRTGPNLDVRVGVDIPTPAGRKALVLSAIGEGRARGLGQMPAGLYQGKEAEEVAAFVAKVAGH
ncbi:MAG: cytochrome c [Actinobacteria bacterium]|nr:MAG: cytochrome c [Actinomycetota bacterium]